MAEPKDRWDKTDIVIKHIIGGLLPLALFILANAVRNGERAEARAQAIAGIVANASKTTTEDQLEMAISPLASYGADAEAPLESIIRAQYDLWRKARKDEFDKQNATQSQHAVELQTPNVKTNSGSSVAPTDSVDLNTRRHRVKFLAMQMSYLGEQGADGLIRLIESLDIGVSNQGFSATYDEDPIAEALSEMAMSSPDIAMPPLIRALESGANQKKDTYAVILRNKNSPKWDDKVLHALLDNAFDPHGGEDSGPHWYVQCVYASATLFGGMLKKPDWAPEQLRNLRSKADALARIGHDPEHAMEKDVTQAVDFALGELSKRQP